MLSLLKIAPQCCDAPTYVSMGSNCALHGTCFGDIRPSGVYYWFSIPERFGLPLNVLILLNILAMLMSVFLSVTAIKSLLQINRNHSAGGWLWAAALLAVSFAVHWIFLYPVLFNTLTDAPASCFFLSAIWLLLSSEYEKYGRKKAVQIAVAGILWGLSVSLRAFFLYPVLGGLAIYMLCWLFTRDHKKGAWLILLAVIPIGSQYIQSYKANGKFSFLGETAEQVMAMHALPVAGYDTLFPGDGSWYAKTCKADYGIQNGVAAGEYAQVACLIGERLWFYLGTYEVATYIFSPVVNQLPVRSEGLKGDPVSWWKTGVEINADTVMAPDGTNTADKIYLQDASADVDAGVFRPIMLQENTSHTFSVWLWSPMPVVLELQLGRAVGDMHVASKTIQLTAEPVRYSLSGVTAANLDIFPPMLTTEDMQHNVAIHFVPGSQPQAADSANPAFFYIWNAQLEVGDHATAYRPYEEPASAEVRDRKPWLLVLNVLMIVAAMTFVIARHQIWLRTMGGLAALIPQLVAAAECIGIIPEQRFAISLMILIWLMAIALLVSVVKKRTGSD